MVPLISFIPESIGPYVLEEEIGEGAFSVVFRAIKKRKRRRSSQIKPIDEEIINELEKFAEDSKEDIIQTIDKTISAGSSNIAIQPGITSNLDPDLQNRCPNIFAIKIFPKTNLKNQTDEKLFQREIQIMSVLKHDHIVSLKNVYSDEKNFYLVMDLCQGSDLSKYIRNKFPSGIPELSAALVFYQIVTAVKYCHSLGIVHRDLKPQNILITNFPSIKISDFGLCDLADENHLMYTYAGSPCYSSPEALSSRQYDGRISDIWSLGVVLYTLVTGTQPWTTSNVSSMTKNIIKGNYRMPNSLSESCRSLISSLLRINPKERLTLDQILQHPWLDQIFLNENSHFIPNGFSLPNLKKLNEKFDVSISKESLSLGEITSENERNGIQDNNFLLSISAPDDSYTSSDNLFEDVKSSISAAESAPAFPQFVKMPNVNRMPPKSVPTKSPTKKKQTKKIKKSEATPSEDQSSDACQTKNVSFKFRYSSFQDAQRVSMKRTHPVPPANQLKAPRRSSNTLPKINSQMD